MGPPGQFPLSPRRGSAPHAHLVGIGGSGMRALAAVLLARGWTISGSDLQCGIEGELARFGVRVFNGHAARQVPAATTRLIYSDAVPPDNPERRRAEELGIRLSSYPQMLAEITAVHSTVAVAGTHGKSTVVAMAAQILQHAGLDPTVLCGATPITSGLGGCHGRGKYAVVEACEYHENFLHLRPDVAVLLNIEPDHFDCFTSSEQLDAAFARLAERVPPSGLIVAPTDCARAYGVAQASGRRVVTFGLSHTANWRAAKLEHSRGRYRFDLVRQGRRLTRVSLCVPGRHNVLNALAAAAVGQHCGAPVGQLVEGLIAFRGLKRRLQPRWTLAGVTWVDDYAHHPTEITASLAALRQMFPSRRICCVFQPHQASRLTALLDELAQSLQNADRIAVAEVFRARESRRAGTGEATAADLADRLRAAGADVIEENDPGEIAAQLAHDLRPGDVLITMGAGDLAKAFDDFHERIGRHCAVA